MDTVTLLQVGDLHYPDTKARSGVDLKDRHLPDNIPPIVAPNPLVVVARTIRRMLNDVAGLLICGDLTSKGNSTGYDEAVVFLRNALDIKSLEQLRVHVVPGNHDIPLDGFDPTAPFTRFVALQSRWKHCENVCFASDTVCESNLNLGKRPFLLASLNTCLLSGLTRSVSLDGKQTEVLDAPAVHEEHIQRLNELIRARTDDALVVILGHHPLLPQSVPRLSPYTEMNNGGLLRSMLSGLKASTIYCHGHIHDDPIEVIQRPERAGGSLIHIGAPLLTDGFNELRLHASSGTLLGLEVIQHRRDTDNILRTRPPVEIRCAHPRRIPDLLDAADREVISGLSGAKRLSQLKCALQPKTLENCLRKLHWLRLLLIRDYHEESRDWIIEKLS